MKKLLFTALTFLTLFAAPLANAQDGEKTILKDKLNSFLAGQTRQHHDSFWAEDLVYTSSNGTRFNKATIMAGFDGKEQAPADDAKVTYSADEIDIRIYEDMAIVAFRLIAREDGVMKQTYFNTGTFVKRDKGWRAVAWQATIIPLSKDIK